MADQIADLIESVMPGPQGEPGRDGVDGKDLTNPGVEELLSRRMDAIDPSRLSAGRVVPLCERENLIVRDENTTGSWSKNTVSVGVLDKGWVRVTKSAVVGTRYAGVYLRVRWNRVEDLKGRWLPQVRTKDGLVLNLLNSSKVFVGVFVNSSMSWGSASGSVEMTSYLSQYEGVVDGESYASDSMYGVDLYRLVSEHPDAYPGNVGYFYAGSHLKEDSADAVDMTVRVLHVSDRRGTLEATSVDPSYMSSYMSSYMPDMVRAFSSAGQLVPLSGKNVTLREGDRDGASNTPVSVHATLSTMAEGVIRYSKPAGAGSSRYAGVYLRVRWDSLDDLSGRWLLRYSDVFAWQGRTILSKVKNWGPSDADVQVPSTSVGHDGGYMVLDLRALVSGAADRFPDNVCYLPICKYAADGVRDAVEGDIQLLHEWNVPGIVTATRLSDELAASYYTKAQVDAKLDAGGSDAYITCWGDSLTNNGGWTERLAALSGLPVVNAGVGGESSRTIMARQGADAILVDDLTIPASGPVTLAIKTRDKGLKTVLGNTVTPALRDIPAVNACRIGNVSGAIAWTGKAYDDPDGAWTFIRSTPGDPVTVDRPTPLVYDLDRDRNSPHLMVIFMGQNDGTETTTTQGITALIRRHRLMIEHAHARNVLILGLSSGSAESRREYETAMRDAFGRYFLSLREYLAHPIYAADGTTVTSCYGLADQGLTPGKTTYNGVEYDALDEIRQGIVPHQMLVDSVHYTTGTKTIIGNLIYRYCVGLGIFETATTEGTIMNKNGVGGGLASRA
ncbi:hypothetical protein [Bifidobacterium simiiventris]|uniref:hypothetical protein n=1 Tax=Bifidobacterium simiiventris TaxID=2834434 RepID=UPI001C590508|nr:hypothetical protein [Bifidobacterium simiiventris]MBW3077681.1 hypothetical protein [Bifidobacterium simiiventris]